MFIEIGSTEWKFVIPGLCPVLFAGLLTFSLYKYRANIAFLQNWFVFLILMFIITQGFCIYAVVLASSITASVTILSMKIESLVSIAVGNFF